MSGHAKRHLPNHVGFEPSGELPTVLQPSVWTAALPRPDHKFARWRSSIRKPLELERYMDDSNARRLAILAKNAAEAVHSASVLAA